MYKKNNYLIFKKKHKNKKNHIIFDSTKVKNDKIIENIINNFLVRTDSFIFESVEKQKIKGRYTIIGSNPDKIWEFNKKKFILYKIKEKKLLKKILIFILKS